MRCVALGLFALLFAGCSSAQPAQPSNFAVNGAAVDPTYSCPGGANNAPYDLHGTVEVHNGTQNPVTIQTITVEMKLVAVQGPWLEKPGDLYDAGAASFSPGSVAPRSSATVNVTVGSACTSNKYEFGGSSRGDYTVTMKLVTSAGSYSVTAANRHEIRAA